MNLRSGFGAVGVLRFSRLRGSLRLLWRAWGAVPHLYALEFGALGFRF